jgi:hypothetical protein
LTPLCHLINLIQVELFIVVTNQAQDHCVICKLDDGGMTTVGFAVMCVDVVQQWTQNTALGSTSADG